MIRSFEVEVEGLRVGESISKFDVDSCICHRTLCHGARSNFRGDGSGTSGVGKDLSVASQMVDERYVYLVEAQSNKENWLSDGSILCWVEEKM